MEKKIAVFQMLRKEKIIQGAFHLVVKTTREKQQTHKPKKWNVT
jgi:hypothetical protein